MVAQIRTPSKLKSIKKRGSNADELCLEEYTVPAEKSVEHFTNVDLARLRDVDSLKLRLETLELKPEGCKPLETLQRKTQPIFTVECQLSPELLQHMPRNEMFNIMQFESDNYTPQTQRTHFGQETQRAINLKPIADELERLNSGGSSNIVAFSHFGRIHFNVWLREPNTCSNELYGLGVFELSELYNGDVSLARCKRIAIQRRGESLAVLYLKVNLLSVQTEPQPSKPSKVIKFAPTSGI
ncbi:uncharacterized protein LOC101453497 [Ceratitis capitata]|uniref:uncharacterized protein LOC101453497 n=1 Tax=Ceratitis capitata TaxID=7213 RepID=UPI00032A3EBC|nr:uncharacterized protein LOC101453497 [Ceratitis capitata]